MPKAKFLGVRKEIIWALVCIKIHCVTRTLLLVQAYQFLGVKGFGVGVYFAVLDLGWSVIMNNMPGLLWAQREPWFRMVVCLGRVLEWMEVPFRLYTLEGLWPMVSNHQTVNTIGRHISGAPHHWATFQENRFREMLHLLKEALPEVYEDIVPEFRDFVQVVGEFSGEPRDLIDEIQELLR